MSLSLKFRYQVVIIFVGIFKLVKQVKKRFTLKNVSVAHFVKHLYVHLC